MSKTLKTNIVEEFKDHFKGLNYCVLLKFEGLGVAQADDLRNHLRKENVSFVVVKDSLAKIAFKELDLPAGDDFFIGPTALAYGGTDVLDAPKAVSEWIKQSGSRALQFKGGMFEGRVLSPGEVKELAAIHSRPQLLSGLLGTILTPAANVLNLVQALQVKMFGLMDALIEKKEKE